MKENLDASELERRNIKEVFLEQIKCFLKFLNWNI